MCLNNRIDGGYSLEHQFKQICIFQFAYFKGGEYSLWASQEPIWIQMIYFFRIENSLRLGGKKYWFVVCRQRIKGEIWEKYFRKPRLGINSGIWNELASTAK